MTNPWLGQEWQGFRGQGASGVTHVEEDKKIPCPGAGRSQPQSDTGLSRLLTAKTSAQHEPSPPGTPAQTCLRKSSGRAGWGTHEEIQEGQ